ncbi:MAG: hypothetical protein FWD18_09685 [Micrococcales bacterium]|nr:hypothetical protein [Micrococcales bacterium]
MDFGSIAAAATSAGITALVAVVVARLSLAGRLRDELSREVDILNKLPKKSKYRKVLSKQIDRRTLLLASSIRFQPMNIWKALSIAISFTVSIVIGTSMLRQAALVAKSQKEILTSTLLPSACLFAAAIPICMFVFHLKSQDEKRVRFAKKRDIEIGEYVERHYGDMRAVVASVGLTIWLIAAMAIFGVVAFRWNSLESSTIEPSDWVMTAILLVAALLVFLSPLVSTPRFLQSKKERGRGRSVA